MPIFDWEDQDIDDYIKKYNIKLSDAYEVYGCKRTGCFLCPFSQELDNDLRILYEYEPNKYKASLFWLKDIFIQQGVKLEFDKEYMVEFEYQQHIIKQRRYEMLLKYRPEIAHKWKPNPQADIFEFINED